MPVSNNMPMIACPSCGAQMQLNATPMETEEANPEVAATEPTETEEMATEMASPEADEFDQQASEIEAKRGKPFRNRSGVAAALREYRG